MNDRIVAFADWISIHVGKLFAWLITVFMYRWPGMALWLPDFIYGS